MTDDLLRLADFSFPLYIKIAGGYLETDVLSPRVQEMLRRHAERIELYENWLAKVAKHGFIDEGTRREIEKALSAT